MRPAVPDTFLPKPRKSTSPAGAGDDTRHASPETFFLARDSSIFDFQATVTEDAGNSAYGVQSLEESIDPSSDSSKMGPATNQPELQIEIEMEEDEPSPQSHGRMTTTKAAEHGSAYRETSPSPSKPRHSRTPSNIPTSLPLSPFLLSSPAEPSSLPSSPKSTSTRSFRHADEISILDENTNQRGESEIESSGLDSSGIQDSDSTPQLIMPSIKMPSRRPFTEKGKSMGRFKVLLAGASGSGKTSLIKSIVQMLEDIVHVDPLPRSPCQKENRKPSKPGSSRAHRSRSTREPTSIVEIYASTKPYPSWWSDLEDSRVLRRRKSTGDFVLERNLCFVDTDGGTLGLADQAECIVQYISQQFQRAVTSLDSANTDFQGLLSGNGGSQVDAILYLISEDSISADISCIRKLSAFANVIPLISKADLLSESQISSIKQSFLSQVREVGARPFLFGDSHEKDGAVSSAPFAVSSANSNDDETMDASILMSPDYVQPLVPSELTVLLEKLFDRDNLAWLRHLASKKLIQSSDLHKISPARPFGPLPKSAASSPSASPFTSPLSSVSPSQVLVPYPGADSGPPSYTMSRVADHTQREEQFAQVRLAKWAAGLQQSLQNERDRYESLAREERAVWLTERLGECVADGTLLPISQTPGFRRRRKPSKGHRGDTVTVRGPDGKHVKYRVADMSSRDPLGLIRWNDDLKRRGWILVQVIGSVGVVGGLALWVAKAWGFTSQGLSEWNVGWLSGD